MVLRCGNCGMENVEDAFTCSQCGESLGAASAVPSPETMNPLGSDVAPYPSAPDLYDPATWLTPAQADSPAQGMNPAAPDLYPPFPQLPYPIVTNVPNSGKAKASLVFGIIGLLICPMICSALAIIYGVQAKNEIGASEGMLGGLGMARAGLVLGVIGLTLGILLMLLVHNL